jgi:hypothetical protein
MTPSFRPARIVMLGALLIHISALGPLHAQPSAEMFELQNVRVSGFPAVAVVLLRAAARSTGDEEKTA